LEKRIVQYQIAANNSTLTYSELRGSGSASPSVNTISSPTRPASDLEEILTEKHNPQYLLKDGIRLKYHSGGNLIGSPIVESGPFVDENVKNSTTGNAMMYDSYSKMLTSNNSSDAFVLRAAVAHECFEREKSISKLYLK
jgi:hypothetical protein